MSQRFEGLTGDESDDDEETAEEVKNTSENARICDDGQSCCYMFDVWYRTAQKYPLATLGQKFET